MLPKVCLYPRREAPVNTFYLLNFRAPKNALSAIFPFLYFFMYFFGIKYSLFLI